MRINSGDKYCGFSMLELRKLLKYSSGETFNVYLVQEALSISLEKSEELIISLENDHYIERKYVRNNIQYYINTLKGNALSLASAAKPIKRETAKKKIDDFLKRVEEVNSNDYYLYSVEEVLIFGSYLSNKERISDIDVAIKLEHKIINADKRIQEDSKRLKEAKNAGRTFSNYVDELFWPQKEVILFLKSRSKALSLHSTDDEILKQTVSKIIYKKK